MSLQLRRLDSRSFSHLMEQWNAHFQKDDILWEHSQPYIEHAQRIAAEPIPDPRYGIYGLVRQLEAEVRYEGFTHINHKLPKTSDAEVRLVWTSLSPRYEDGFDYNDLAELTYCCLRGAIALAQGELKARSVRLHLSNLAERTFALDLANGLRAECPNVPIALAGNWLHIGDVDRVRLGGSRENDHDV